MKVKKSSISVITMKKAITLNMNFIIVTADFNILNTHQFMGTRGRKITFALHNFYISFIFNT